jgi:hypothetical protein
MPDHDLARQLGRHPSSVVSKRLALKIPYRKPRYRWWRKSEIQLLGTKPDQELAIELRRPVEGIIQKRIKLGIPNRFLKRRTWTPQELQWLGRLSDRQIAKRTHRSLDGVQDKRRSLGLADPGLLSTTNAGRGIFPTVFPPAECPCQKTLVG